MRAGEKTSTAKKMKNKALVKESQGREPLFAETVRQGDIVVLQPKSSRSSAQKLVVSHCSSTMIYLKEYDDEQKKEKEGIPIKLPCDEWRRITPYTS